MKQPFGEFQEQRTCAGTTAAGQRCRHSRGPASEYCQAHDPDPRVRERFLERCRRGGLNHRVPRWLGAYRRLRDPASAVHALTELWQVYQAGGRRTRRGVAKKVSREDVRLALALVEAWLRAYQLAHPAGPMPTPAAHAPGAPIDPDAAKVRGLTP